MNIIVSEHEVISELLTLMLQEHDPDYPMGISPGIIKRLEDLLFFSVRIPRKDIDRFLEPSSRELLKRLNADVFLSELLALPFDSIHVVDNQGTLVLTFSEKTTS